jgi:hypothetical protein
MGQFGVVAERVVETVFGCAPWERDPERADPLAEALDDWTRRTVTAFLGALQESAADLWLVHDRAVVFSGGALELGPWDDAWSNQIRSMEAPLEASDALAGVNVPHTLEGSRLTLVRKDRWIWPVAPRQRHLVESLHLRPSRLGG